MATILLAAAGNALFPAAAGSFAWGSVLGGLAGGFVDRALFPPPDQKGPRLDGMKLGSGIEGSPIPLVLGTERVPGNAIWMGPVREHENSEGKGGPSSTTYTYSADIAFAFCEGEIYRIRRIWANGAILYDADADVTITSDDISVTQTILQRWNEPLQTYVGVVYMDLTSPAGGPDLSKLKSGKNAVLSGFAAGGNNGTFRVVSSSIDTVTGISTARLRNATAVTASSGALVTIFQDLPEFSTNKMSAAPTIYLGTETQTPDALIQSYKGAAATPAFRGTVYVVFHQLQFEDFGNSVPQLQAEIERVNGTMTIANAITTVLSRGARALDEFDVTGVTGNLRGMVIRDPQPIADSLGPILLAYDILTQQDGGVLKFFNRTAAPQTTIEESELAAHEPGSETPRPFEVEPTPLPELPVLVTVKYVDTTNDLQPGTQPYRGRRRPGSSDNVRPIDLPIVLTPSEAQDIARRMYHTARANQNRVTWTLPPSRIDVQENDRFNVEGVLGTDWSLLVGRVDRGVNSLVQGDSVTEEDDCLTYTNSPAEDAATDATTVFTVPEMEAVVIDLAPFASAHEQVPGIYLAAAHLDSTVVFKGAAYFVSDNDSTYFQANDVPIEATMGNTTNAPSSSGISGAYWDRKSSLNVKFFNGEPASAPEIDVLNGANRALWGREVIGFATATLQPDGTYTLTNLLRGLAGTDDMLATHLAGDIFVLLTGAGLLFRELSFSDVGKSRYLKVVATGGIVSQFDPLHFKQSCNNLRHFAPCQVRAVRDSGTNDIAIAWTRRTRAVWRVLGTVAAPLLDTAETYELEVWNDLETLVLRTVTVSAATSFTYTSAMQTTDFGSPHANVHVRVYQIHSLIGRSKAATAVL